MPPLTRLRRALPKGGGLPDHTWWHRHRGILLLLWFHAAIIPAFAVIRGFSLGHGFFDALVVAGPAVFATMSGLPRRARMVAAAGGLLSASAVLVHLSGGLIEMHFHFFFIVAVVALYQDWIPFLASFVYVLVHHGVVGALDPLSVFNHPAAINHPWTWAIIHAFFIAGISATLLVHWRLNETYLAQRKKAEDQARREAQTVTRLNEIAKSLTADFEVSHVVQKVTDAVTELTSAQSGAFLHNTEDASGGSYKLYTPFGAPKEAFASFPVSHNTAMFEPAYTGREIVRVEDVTKDPRYGIGAPEYGMPTVQFPIRSYMAVPVVSRGKVLGGLFFGHEEPGRFTEEDERLAVGLAAHAAAAIEGATLFESERRLRQRASILAEASHILGKSLDLDRILEEFARLVVPTLADSFVADVVQSDGSLRRVALLGDERFVDAIPGRAVAPPAMEDTANPIVRAVLSGQSELIETVSETLLDATITDLAYREFVRRLASRSVAVVPLVTRTHVVGVFWMGTVRASGRRLGSDDLQLAEDLARRAAVAVENTTLYSQQRTAAETLQHALLPDELPDVPGLSTAARYVPGGPGIEVGGDWYDAVTLRDGSVALAMGDVVGHGIGAASLMGQLKSALRVYSFEGYEPAEILRRLNNMLHEFGPGDKMATLVYGRFDPSTGVLRFASAGHPPPLVVAPDGTARFIEETSGIPLGALDRARYTEAVVAVPPGSTIVLYTDGLVETRTMPLDEGMTRLRVAAEAWRTSDLDILCDEMLECAAGAEDSDDVAILALRWHSLGDVLKLELPARPSVLRPLRTTLRRWLQDAGASEQETFEILAATGEAVTNVIRHASRAESASFEMEAERNESIRLNIRDHGRWRERAEPKPGGQGLIIMTQFMDSVDFEREPAGTSVTMRRRLASSIRTSR